MTVFSYRGFHTSMHEATAPDGMHPKTYFWFETKRSYRTYKQVPYRKQVLGEKKERSVVGFPNAKSDKKSIFDFAGSLSPFFSRMWSSRCDPCPPPVCTLAPLPFLAQSANICLKLICFNRAAAESSVGPGRGRPVGAMLGRQR